MRTIAIIQARMGSSRLPGKVLRPVVGKPMLAHIVERLRLAQGVNEVIVATSDQVADEQIVSFCSQSGIACFTGSESNVLDRFYRAALHYQGDAVIRITADCPLVDPAMISQLITLYQSGEYDHVSVATGAGALFMDGGRFPDGYDAECIRFTALHEAWRDATLPGDREHVTPYLWRQPEKFRLQVLKSATDYSSLRLTVDNEEDFQLIEHIYQALYQEHQAFLLSDVVEFLTTHPELSHMNQAHIGNEGYAELWQAAAN